MSACVCSVASPVAAARARVAPRASGAKGVVVARGKGKVSGPARLAARSSTAALRAAKPAASRRGARVITAASADDDEPIPFGYTRQDVILIGVGMTAAGFGLYYGLQANGVSAIWAGNIVQLTFVGGLSLAWVASYVLRVMNKDMTYVKQLKDYEDAVMAKRLEELPEAELEKMMDDISKLDPK